MPVGAEIALNVLSSILMLLLLAAFPYSIVWSKGDRDKNSVNFGHMQEDKLRGLKVGLMAAIPSAIGYIVLVLSKLGVCFSKYIFLYRFANVRLCRLSIPWSPLRSKTPHRCPGRRF